MFWHWQNLNEDKRDLLHGRAWWHFGTETAKYPRPWRPLREMSIQIAWRIGPWTWIGLVDMEGADEVDYGISFGLGFLQLYLQFAGFRAHNAMPRCVFGFDTGIMLYGEMLTLQWNNDSSSTEYIPNGRGGRITRDAHGWRRTWMLLDVFLGRAEHSSKATGFSFISFIRMPERAYECMVRLHRDTWKRPRWPWPLVVDRATVEIPSGVPFPGKGENSWDCGEDRTYSSTMPAKSVKEALEKVQTSIAERRLKYGGPNWKPEGVT